MKKFFKNDWVRSISVLLIIAVVLSGLLAILNDVLLVAPEVRTMRAIKKIYGQEMAYVTVIDVDNEDDTLPESVRQPVEYDEGKINKIYEVGDKTSGQYELLFQTTGFNGYKGGTVTVWVQVTVNNGVYSISKVLYQGNEKQTLMSKFGNEFYSKFELTDVTEAYKQGKSFSPTDGDNVIANPVTGATKSATAGNNAVNCVLNYLGGLTNEN